MISLDVDTQGTRTRILEAGAAVFAASGFSAATVRTICSRAQVNVAAINYHFGGKEELYREVLRFARKRVHDKYPMRYGITGAASAKERLHAFVRSFLLRTCADDESLCWGTLVMREMVEPTSALDMMVDEGIRALFAELAEIVGLLLGEAPDSDRVTASARSVLSQCLFYLFSRGVIRRMSAGSDCFPYDIEKIALHIVSFSCHALEGMAAEGKAGGADE